MCQGFIQPSLRFNDLPAVCGKTKKDLSLRKYQYDKLICQHPVEVEVQRGYVGFSAEASDSPSREGVLCNRGARDDWQAGSRVLEETKPTAKK